MYLTTAFTEKFEPWNCTVNFYELELLQCTDDANLLLVLQFVDVLRKMVTYKCQL